MTDWHRHGPFLDTSRTAGHWRQGSVQLLLSLAITLARSGEAPASMGACWREAVHTYGTAR